MNALALIEPSETGALSLVDTEATHTFATASKAAATQRAYREDGRAFGLWCRARGLCPLPAASQHGGRVPGFQRPFWPLCVHHWPEVQRRPLRPQAGRAGHTHLP